MVALATDANQSRRWGLLGVMMMLAAFLILSFYSVIAGWAIPYVGHAASGAFDGASAKEVGGIFGGLLASPGKLLLWHTVFMALTVGVSASGVKGGIERAVTILMPSLLVLLIVFNQSQKRRDRLTAGAMVDPVGPQEPPTLLRSA